MSEQIETPALTVNESIGEALFSALRKSLTTDPLQVKADAYAVIALLEATSTSHPESAQQVIHGCWQTVTGRSQATLRQRTANDQVLDEYFKHRGDWSGMKSCIARQAREQFPDRAREWDEKSAESQQRVWAEFALLIGSGT